MPPELLELPPLTTDEGVLARLLIAENWNPGYPQYDAQQTSESMLAMRWTVHNRRWDPNPEQFLAPHAANYTDIITAPGQFEGFSKNASGEVVISAKVQQRTDRVLEEANTGSPGKYYEFAVHAINLANAGWPHPSAGIVGNAIDLSHWNTDDWRTGDPFYSITDIEGVPVVGGTYAFKAVNAPSPGKNFIAIPVSRGGIIQGTQFYTLKKQ